MKRIFMPIDKIKYTYSFDGAKKKIATFIDNNYFLMSTISEQVSIRPLIRSAQFILKKQDNYYQYKAEYLFANERSNQIELLEKDLTPVTNHEYIYVIVYQPKNNSSFILLRENAAISGHDFLIRPYKHDECSFVGGELYFYNKRPLLINNKSGSFQTSAAEASEVIKRAFGFNQTVFHSAVEKSDVDKEISRRRMALDATKPGVLPVPRPETFFYKRPAIAEQPPPKTVQCSCSIM